MTTHRARIARELALLIGASFACALIARISLARALAHSPATRASIAAAHVAAVAPVEVPAPLPPLEPVADAVARRPTRARPSRRAASAGSTAHNPAAVDPWVELRPRLSERSDGTLRADLRGVTSISEFARGARFRASPLGGFEVLSLDGQGYLQSAGVRAGDRLVAINGRGTRTLDELLSAYALSRLGSTLSLQFARGQGHYAISAEVLRGDP